jgi:hypothetical protein
LPFTDFCWVNVTPVKADDKSRNPEDPVSTNTPSIVWQVVVPGAQTVTLVNAPLA